MIFYNGLPSDSSRVTESVCNKHVASLGKLSAPDALVPLPVLIGMEKVWQLNYLDRCDLKRKSIS
eukprot:1622490-Amphidinium_carterae.4